MFYWIYTLPSSTLAIVLSTFFVGFYWAGCILLRPILRQFVRSRTSGTNDVVGSVLSCFSVFYGLLLGLIAVAAYQNYVSVDASVTEEASALASLYHDFESYPEPYGQNLRWLTRDYTRYTIKYGWPMQRKGLIPEEGEIRVQGLRERLVGFNPKNPREEILHAEALSQFNHFVELRRIRLYAVTTGIPAVMWYVVIVGSIINLAIVWLFEMRFITHLFLGGLLAFYLGTVIFLIAAMDNPYRGEVSVSPAPFESLYKRMVD